MQGYGDSWRITAMVIWTGYALADSVEVFPQAQVGAAYGPVTYLWVAGLSVLGASASYLQQITERPALLSTQRFLAELVTAIAAGLCAFWGGEAMGSDLRVTAAGVLLAGYCGKQGLNKLRNKNLSG
jgi:hypothetical protein